jgi:glutaredoxin
MNNKIIIGIFIVGLLFAMSCTTKNYDAFAKCLAEKNATMYGAYWCPHCQEQKELFKGSFVYVPYVECDAKGTNGQPELCKENNVTGYPTWIINGQMIEGRVPLQTLSQATGCALS